MRLMRLYGLEEAIRGFSAPVFGTCAGMILLDRAHLGLIDVEVERNSYGRQLASFEADLELEGETEPLRGVFIRAPRVAEIGRGRRGARRVTTACRCCCATGRFLVASFHPELTGDTRAARAIPATGEGGAECQGIASGRPSSTRRALPTRSAGKLFTKLSQARSSSPRRRAVPDPAANLSLQNAIEKAKSYSMPKDIDRARDRDAAPAPTRDAAAYETIVYEGYGPDGVAVLVEALTDNRNRTASEVRHTFAKHGGNLGTTGAVAWLFERRGVVLVDADSTWTRTT